MKIKNKLDEIFLMLILFFWGALFLSALIGQGLIWN